MAVKGMDALLFLTYRCTSRCKTCNMWKRQSACREQELGWPQWRSILNDLHASGVKTVEIFGGDALLRKSVIFDMIRFCADHGMKTFFPTNSILLDGETAKQLVDSGLGTIYFSLDDVAAESDMIRGVTDSFAKVKEALDNIVSARGQRQTPRIIICTTISKLNYDHFERVVEFLSAYPVAAIYPRPLGEFHQKNIAASRVNGIPPEPYFVSTEESHLLSDEQIALFRATVRRLQANGQAHRPYINFRAVDMAPDTAFTAGYFGITRCHCCTTFIAVAPNGDVLTCPFFPHYALGNLTQEGITKIWGKVNPSHLEFINAQRRGEITICGNCNMRPYYPTLAETAEYYVKRCERKLLGH